MFGRFVAMASFMIGIGDVLDAKTAPGGDDLVERAEEAEVYRFVLGEGLDDKVAVGHVADVRRELRTAERGLCVIRRGFSRLTPRPNEVPMRARPRASASSSTSRTGTSSPAPAHTSAMPAPISPHPPTRSTDWPPGVVNNHGRTS